MEQGAESGKEPLRPQASSAAASAQQHAAGAGAGGGPPRRMNDMELNMFRNSYFPPSCGTPPEMYVINAVARFHKLPEEAAIVETFRALLPRFVRLHARANADGSWAVMRPEEVNMGFHVQMAAEVAGEEELVCRMEELAGRPLDDRQPLWQVHLLPNSSGDAAVLLRVHHSVADGLALSRLVREIVTTSSGGRLPEVDALKKFGAAACGTSQTGRRRRCCGCARRAGRLLGRCVGVLPALLSNVMASMVPLEPDSRFSPSRATRQALQWSGRRTVLFVPPLSLTFVKACKAAMGATVNDVLLGAAAGAFRRYCAARGDPLLLAAGPPQSRQASRFRALVPVMLPPTFPRGTGEDDLLCNNWCFCSVPFPVAATGPLNRVREAQQHMSQLKKTMKAPVSNWLVNGLGPWLPGFLRKDITRKLFMRHSMVFSNVMGPQEQVYLCGQPVVGLTAFFYNQIPQVILVSYAGRIHMNMVVDPVVVQEPGAFVQHFLEELRELGAVLGVAAEGGPLADGGELGSS